MSYETVVRGASFEVVLKKLLERGEYSTLPEDGEHIKKGWVRGRGCWHQIDALGAFELSPPFINPIRLLAEAKWYEGRRSTAGLDTVRNFVGVVKDISENYFIEDGQSVDDPKLFKRYTDCGAVFSVNGFSPDAERYAYAQGLYLVSYKNYPLLRDMILTLKPMIRALNLIYCHDHKNKYCIWFGEQITRPTPQETADYLSDAHTFYLGLDKLREELESVKTSAIGTLDGRYPIHLMSEASISQGVFMQTDEVSCRIINYDEESPTTFSIKLQLPKNYPPTVLYTSIPPGVLKRYSQQMARQKKEIFHYVDVPMRFNNIRRILRFKFSEEDRKQMKEKILKS